jgi:glycosyltransferase involved in cell wall biosynthesis
VGRTVWVVSELYYPEDTSTGYFLTKIAEGLAGSFAVNVLCAQPTYAHRGLRAPREEKRNGVHIFRCAATTLDKNVLLFRIANHITVALSIFVRAVGRFHKDDYVLVVTNPPLLPFLILAACRLRRAKCVLLIHDVYPEALIAAGMLRSNSLAARALSRLTSLLYRGVSRVVVLGRDMRKLVLRRARLDSDRVVVIPNWADLDEIIPGGRASSALIAQLGLRAKFVVQYSGNIGRTHGIERLLDAARALADREEIHLLFIGSGAKFHWLRRAVQAENLPNVSLLPLRPRHELSDSLNACDLAVISFIPGMAGISVPSRMYNILASGRPILAVADPESELAMLVREEGVGWVVPPDRADRVVEAVLEAYGQPEQLAQMGMRARRFAESSCALSSVVAAYVSLMRELDADRD